MIASAKLRKQSKIFLVCAFCSVYQRLNYTESSPDARVYMFISKFEKLSQNTSMQ